MPVGAEVVLEERFSGLWRELSYHDAFLKRVRIQIRLEVRSSGSYRIQDRNQDMDQREVRIHTVIDVQEIIFSSPHQSSPSGIHSPAVVAQIDVTAAAAAEV